MALLLTFILLYNDSRLCGKRWKRSRPGLRRRGKKISKGLQPMGEAGSLE
jgi:hypothetical protein